MQLSILLEEVDIVNAENMQNVEIDGIQFDSRKVKAGDLYVCLPGTKADGHDFALSARENGAAAIIGERDINGLDIPYIKVKNARIAFSKVSANLFGNPSKDIKVIGVTGTNGKTTVTHLVKEILNNAGCKCGLIGTTHNIVGDKVLEASMTTPDPVELHGLFRMMADEGCEYAVMEVSSHSLAWHKLDSVRFAVGAYTNLTQDHLDFHKTMDNYFCAKKHLFELSEKAVVNADDEYGRKVECNNLLTYSVDENSDIKAENAVYSADGISFDCVTKDGVQKINLSIPGGFSVYNALTSIGICLQLGMTMPQIADGLAKAHGVKGRVEVVPTGRDFTILIDYAHTPDALENVLKTIRGYAKGRIVALFGCGGDRDKTKRPIMGGIGARLADFCVVTSDNPRSEIPGEIIKDILVGMAGFENKLISIENRAEAIKYAIDNAQKDDVILLAGKGHETYQVLKDKTIHFDEREVIKKCLEAGV